MAIGGGRAVGCGDWWRTELPSRIEGGFVFAVGGCNNTRSGGDRIFIFLRHSSCLRHSSDSQAGLLSAKPKDGVCPSAAKPTRTTFGTRLLTRPRPALSPSCPGRGPSHRPCSSPTLLHERGRRSTIFFRTKKILSMEEVALISCG